MSRKHAEPTPEQLAEAKELRRTLKNWRGRPLGWDRIAKMIGGISQHELKKHLDPKSHARRNEKAMLYERRRSRRRHGTDYLLGRGKPSEQQLAERDRALSYEPTPNHIILGDPPPGRSALERRAQ